MFQTTNALVNLIQKWHNSINEMYRVIKIVLLDIRKAFDLIDHNTLLGNLKKMGINLPWLSGIRLT